MTIIPVVPGLLLTFYDRTLTTTQDFTKVIMTRSSVGTDQMNLPPLPQQESSQDESSESQMRKVMRTEIKELGY